MGILSWWYRRQFRKAMLFTFWDGRRLRRADGFRLFRKLQKNKDATDPLILKKFQEGDPEATETYLNALAEVFEVARYDYKTEQGLTDPELLNLAAVFAQWIEKKKV